MTMISINRNAEGKVVFDPPSVQVLAQDLVFWVNNDLLSAHQPTPKGQVPDRWLADPIPAAAEGQPAATSPAISLNVAILPITYVDGLDAADGAEGTLTA
jgi:plastocyanin